MRRGRAALSSLLAGVFLLLFASRGDLRTLTSALRSQDGARPPRLLPEAYRELLAKAVEVVPQNASVLYSSRVRAEDLDPDSRRFASEGRPRPDADMEGDRACRRAGAGAAYLVTPCHVIWLMWVSVERILAPLALAEILVLASLAGRGSERAGEIREVEPIRL